MLSSKDIETIVSQAFKGESVEIINHCLKCYSEDRIGFLGDHQNLFITIKRSNSSKPETHQFFVKAVPEGSEEQSKFIEERGVFHQEALFFNSVLPHLKESCVTEDWCPDCLLANDKIVVLEDLRERGYAMHKDKIFKGDILKSSVKAQARLHASSLLAEKTLGKSLKDMYPKACVEHLFIKEILDHKQLELYSNLAEELAKRQGLDHRRIFNLCTQGFMRLYSSEDKGKLSRVISHGDTWPNNSLFDSSNPPKCILVDFQLVRYVPRMYDVAQLIYLSTTLDIRKNEEREAIECYYKELCDVLKKNNPSFEIPSLQDILDEYEDVRPSAMFAAIMYYPVILLSKEVLNKYKDNVDEIYKKVMFRNNNDFILELCDQEEVYGNRLKDLVKEIATYSEKIKITAEKQNGLLINGS